MVLFLIAATAIFVAYLVHLVAVIRSDRSLSPPRSHSYELDPATVRLGGAWPI
jgi:hypothetical protein